MAGRNLNLIWHTFARDTVNSSTSGFITQELQSVFGCFSAFCFAWSEGLPPSRSNPDPGTVKMQPKRMYSWLRDSEVQPGLCSSGIKCPTTKNCQGVKKHTVVSCFSGILGLDLLAEPRFVEPVALVRASRDLQSMFQLLIS